MKPTLPVDEQAVAQYNQRGLNRRLQRRYPDAIEIFREAISIFPHEATLQNNLAVTLEESGDSEGALAAYRAAVTIDARLWPALFGAGMQLMRRNEYAEAESFFERALAVAPDLVPAHMAIYELAQIRGDRKTALEHQAAALGRQQLFSEPAATAKRRILAVMAPGDWQANVPVDLLFDRSTTAWHKLYLIGAQQLRNLELPEYDVVFNAIAESDEAVSTLQLCEDFIAMQAKPALNNPKAVLNTNRVRLPDVLASTDCNVPATVRLSRAKLDEAGVPFKLPYIIRPVGSHAGRGLEKIERAEELARYLARATDREFYATQYVDYRNADGYFRKFRIIVVDGEPFPFHMAISANWMVHYYNAPMAEFAWMRSEEERYLADFEGFFTPRQRQAFRDIATCLGLDYFGIDCAVDNAGRVLVFEADPGVIVHLGDSIETYPYKHQYVPRIFRAVEQLVDSRIARSN